MLTIDPKDLTVGRLHNYLLSAVAPRPIAFASTVDEAGNHNLAPFSFFNVFSANPPIAIFSPARRGRDGSTKHTYENVLKIPEVVINVVNYALVQQCSLASTEYGAGVSEFVKAGLTPLPSDLIRPARVAESPVQMECIVRDVVALGDGGGAGNLVIAEVVRLHISEAILDAEGNIDPALIDLVGRCGGNYYVRTDAAALFEVAKPLARLGIGVDSIPADIRLSKVLTGNHLGMLGNVEVLPNETDVNEYKLIELAELFIDLEDNPVALELALHRKAAELLDQGDVAAAWQTLLAFNNG
jgi:flavin reductase (DIM6/NTAB) family NADH-FMN oxidoreductase RutF